MEQLEYIAERALKAKQPYATLWERAGVRTGKEAAEKFSSLPTVKWRDVCTGPLDDRLTTDSSIIVKYVRDTRAGLSAYTIESLREEASLSNTNRPLVWFADWGENMQWAMWASMHGRLPLVAEEHERATTLLARHYGADSLITDSKTLLKAVAVLTEAVGKDALRDIIVIDSDMPDPEAVFALAPQASLVFMYALPETGVLGMAQVRRKETPVFESNAHTILERAGDSLIVTRLISLPIPIIRYETACRVQPLKIDGGKIISFTV